MSKTGRRLFYVCMGSVFLFAQNGNAVPSFARQTGMSCIACHTSFPQLTPYGRIFKLMAFSFEGSKQIETENMKAVPGVKIDSGSPISAVIQASWAHVRKVSANTENDHASLPSEFSLYYAGEISPNMGAFIQATMDNASSNFKFDMADIRYAQSTTIGGDKSLVYGLALDNMPGMEDLWNTTPAWTYPYLAASPSRGDGPVVNSIMGTGLGTYAMLDNQWYAYVSDYKPMGSKKVDGGHGNPYADNPYWRLAWQKNVGSGNWEIGTYGMQTKFFGATAGTDKFTDFALDTQYELPTGDNCQIDAHAVYINEDQKLGGSSPSDPKQHINQYRADVDYIVNGRHQYLLGYFSTTGSSGAYKFDGDAMQLNAYGGNNDGYIAEYDYLPWENTKLSLQYTTYAKLNGTRGSTASNGNTLLGNVWVAW